MRDHLIAKNVAAEIAEKLCDSVATKLEGRVLGTFHTVTATVRSALTESCIQILTPRRRIDILRDALDSRERETHTLLSSVVSMALGSQQTLQRFASGLLRIISACSLQRVTHFVLELSSSCAHTAGS
jgi:signal recognition particle receptor subunit alpha